MFVIMAVATDARAAGLVAGVAISGTVACAALLGGPMTGASMNPHAVWGLSCQWAYRSDRPLCVRATGWGNYRRRHLHTDSL